MRKTIILSTVIAIGLTGCIGGKKAPDETRVVAGPSLMLPPEFNLTPPTNGVATPAERAANQEVADAQSALLGAEMNAIEPAAVAADSTSSVDFLLENQAVDANIRQTLETEAATE